MSDLVTVIGPEGLQPTPPQQILQQLITLVQSVRPGYTASLPASLIEDISSTDVYAIALVDAARVELVNSLTPMGANVFLLAQLGQMLGVTQGKTTNTSVFCVFTGPPGYVISEGFTVSDGTFQYTVQDAGIIGAGGTSDQLFCLATIPGSWAVPQNVVTQIITSVPPSVTLTVTNPEAGLPGSGAESEAAYRVRVLQANLAESQGMPAYLKTLLTNVPGVQARLVSVRQQTGGGYMVIVGGGDPNDVANAIFESLFDISILTGSMLLVTSITNANPGVVTCNHNHNYTTGQVIGIVGVVGMGGINNVPLTVTVITPTSFSIGIDTTSSGAYISGGIITPNLRNLVVPVNNYPDTYSIPIVIPPQQVVAVSCSWSTITGTFSQPAAVAQLGQTAIVDYVNSIAAGQPINLNVMNNMFADAISGVLPTDQLSALSFIVTIDGITTPPLTGTQIIPGDPESYFQTQASLVTVIQA